MPGLTFIHRPGTDTGPSLAEDARAGLDACRYDERYRLRRLLDRPDRLLVSAAYDEYPVAAFETPRYRLVLEGRLYDVDTDELEDELRRLADLIFEGRRKPVRAWLLGADGAFLFFAEEKESDRWAFLNDALGRLPVYHHATDRAFFLSRSFPFFAQLEDGPPPDPLGLAQQLTHSFPLGQRTLLRGVRRMQPGTLLRGTDGSAEAEATAVYTFDFEARPHRRRSRAQNAERLAGLLGEACTRRAGCGERDVLALSGGLDSRAVAFAFAQENLPFERVTFRRPGGGNTRDVEGAEEIARLCGGAAGATLSLGPSTGRHCTRLLRATGGRNLLYVAYTIDFLEQVQRRLGSAITFLTGDGGGYLLPDRRPAHALPDPDALADYVTEAHWLPPAQSARLTGVSEARLHDSLRTHLAAFPERTPAQKYVHFCIFDRLFNFSFIGEERSRCYFWESAPLYGLPFFRYVMGCPDDQKTHFALFREMLLQLSPRALDVGYPNFLGTKMTAWGYRSYAFMRALVRRVPPLKRFLERTLGRSAPPSDALLTALRRQREAPAVAEVLDPHLLLRLLAQPDALSRLAWTNLFTATSFLEWQRGDRPTVLDDRADARLP